MSKGIPSQTSVTEALALDLALLQAMRASISFGPDQVKSGCLAQTTAIPKVAPLNVETQHKTCALSQLFHFEPYIYIYISVHIIYVYIYIYIYMHGMIFSPNNMKAMTREAS